MNDIFDLDDKKEKLIIDSRSQKINALIKHQEKIIKEANKAIEDATQEINIIKERYKNDKRQTN